MRIRIMQQGLTVVLLPNRRKWQTAVHRLPRAFGFVLHEQKEEENSSSNLNTTSKIMQEGDNIIFEMLKHTIYG
ncbi:MAG TPA: hypothetical protein PKV73_04325 [Agriterribacter sp.]|nr:hypothetical protein [Agriterribacter sp.]